MLNRRYFRIKSAVITSHKYFIFCHRNKWLQNNFCQKYEEIKQLNEINTISGTKNWSFVTSMENFNFLLSLDSRSITRVSPCHSQSSHKLHLNEIFLFKLSQYSSVRSTVCDKDFRRATLVAAYFGDLIFFWATSLVKTIVDFIPHWRVVITGVIELFVITQSVLRQEVNYKSSRNNPKLVLPSNFHLSDCSYLIACLDFQSKNFAKCSL